MALSYIFNISIGCVKAVKIINQDRYFLNVLPDKLQNEHMICENILHLKNKVPYITALT